MSASDSHTAPENIPTAPASPEPVDQQPTLSQIIANQPHASSSQTAPPAGVLQALPYPLVPSYPPQPADTSANAQAQPPHSYIGAPPAAQLPPPPRTPGQYYTMLANQLHHAISKDWEPHVMTPDDVAKHLHATQRRVERIHVLEAEQARAHPIADPRIEKALFFARIDYRTRFPRIFRINDLPTEILSNILRFICWSAPDPHTSTLARLHLTWVCRHWRAVMLGDHTLWNAIWFADYPHYERSITWLERAGNCALDVRINDTPEKPWTVEIAQAVLDKLFSKLTSIRVLVVVLQDWDPILYLMHSLCRVKSDNLSLIMERLEVHRKSPTYIQSGSAFAPTYYRSFVQLFGGAHVPTFNHLTTNGVHIDWSRSALMNLKTLDLRRIPLERTPNIVEFRTILCNSPTLQKLVLDGAGPKWPRGPITAPPVDMPSLRSLAMGDFSPEYGVYAAAQFTFPNALDFTLMNVIRQDYTPFYQLLTARMPLLRVLTLYGADIGVDAPPARAAFVRFLEALPQLAFLRINSVAPPLLDLFLWDAERMQPAASDVAEPPKKLVCPALRVLEYHTMETEYIARWITARRQLGVPLGKVYIGEQTVREMTQADRDKLTEAVGSAGSLAVLNPILRPVEELHLLSEKRGRHE